jgi:hypothetical protein
MKRILFLPFFLLAFALQAQTNFYSQLNFTDTAIVNHTLTLTVSGYWDSIATSNSGPYTQVINTSTQSPGVSIDTISVPANILDIRTGYTYLDCLGNNTSTGLSPIVTAMAQPLFNVQYCQSNINCNYNAVWYPDSTNLTARAITGSVFGPTHTNTTYNWDMGDGTSLNGKNISHVYAANGTYTITTIVTVRGVNNIIACLDTIIQQITVPLNTGGGCNASFTKNSNGANLQVTGISYSGNWTFLVDNTVYTTRTFWHTFSGAGVYPIQAINTINNASGYCSDTINDTILIWSVPTPTYGIYGLVSNLTAGTNDTAEVMLIQSSIDSATGGTRLDLISTITVIDTTTYAFTNLPAGNYYIKAALTSGSPSYSTKLPTYYGDELLWSNASVVSIGPWQNNVDINLITGTNPGGPGFISGLVIQGANKTMSGGPWDVFLTTDQDVPVDYQQTDANNQYNFTNLAYGTYKVFVEIPGSIVSPHLVTIDANNPGATGIGFEADSLATGPLAISESNQVGFTLFPNPANDKVQIGLSSLSKDALTLNIYNTKGGVVFTQTIQAGSNSESLEINLSDWDAGLYIIRVSQGNTITFKKMQKL